MLPAKRSRIIIPADEKAKQRFRRKRILIRCVAFSPLVYLLLERILFLPFGNNSLSSYLDVEHVAITTIIKTKAEDKGSKEYLSSTTTTTKASLESITQPFRVKDMDSTHCSVRGTKSIIGYHHLGSTTTTSTSSGPEMSAPASRQRKIPKIMHQHGRSRCVPSRLYNLNQQWKQHLLMDDRDGNGDNEGDEWSIYFHTEDAMARLFRAAIAVRQGAAGPNTRRHGSPLIISDDFPHLGQILRTCIKNRSFIRGLLWRFVCLYIYGGMFVDLEYAPPPTESYGDNMNTIIDDNRNDAVFFIASDKDKGDSNNLRNSWGGINTNIMAVSPEHPILYYAIQHLLFQITTDGYADQDDSNKTIQHYIVSDILERSLADFMDKQSVSLFEFTLGKHSTESRTKTYSGTGKRTVTIIDSSSGDTSSIGTSNHRHFFQMIANFQRKPRASPIVDGSSFDHKVFSPSNQSLRKHPPSCLHKILADISKSSSEVGW